MRLVICSTDIGHWAARFVKQRIQAFSPTCDRPFVLGLPTGSTPLSMYRALIDYYQAGELSFEHVVTFNMDEYVGLPATHPKSYATYMHHYFFDHINIPPHHIHLLDGDTADLDAECQQYEAAIAKVGGIHLFIGGVGEDGHIAFNEPGSSISSRTQVKPLTDSTRRANARFFHGNVDAVPKLALTVGVGTILDAQEVLILAQGERKAMAVHHAIEGCINHMWTVTALQLHPRAVLACDDAATAELKVKTVRYFKEMNDYFNTDLS